MADPALFATLAKVLGDPDRGVRYEAVEALVRLKDPRAVDPLIAVLRDPDGDVRFAAAWSLGEIGDPAATGPLVEALKDENWRVRTEALQALSKIADPTTTGAIVMALGDVEKGFEDADLVLENEFRTSYQFNSPLARPVSLCKPLPNGGIEVWNHSQGIHWTRLS
jgi:HEAT repeat protein